MESFGCVIIWVALKIFLYMECVGVAFFAWCYKHCVLWGVLGVALLKQFPMGHFVFTKTLFLMEYSGAAFFA